ncbi:MAG: hypothetical protein IPK32_07065 [Verrucomicrobiaceae bacterium]|nr:hypothetical protein [Verrucomicrobiaceae bacterium]
MLVNLLHLGVVSLMVQTMSGQIIPLKCPSCGNTHSEQLIEHAFGAEFKCESCGMTSVLVINKQLYLRQVGEHVCRACGRVAPKGTRFCQCTKSLIQKCPTCRKEFFVDDAICPECGWRHELSASSLEGQEALAARIRACFDKRDLTGVREDFDVLYRSAKEAGRISPDAARILADFLVARVSGELDEMEGTENCFHSNYYGWVDRAIPLLQKAMPTFLTNITKIPNEMIQANSRLIGEVIGVINGPENKDLIGHLEALAMKLDVLYDSGVGFSVIAALGRIGPDSASLLKRWARTRVDFRH